jgi:protein-disulfide isomerase
MNIFQDRSALAVLAFLAVATVGLTFAVARVPSAEADTRAGYSKKEIERIVHEYIVQNPEVLMEAMSALQAKEDKSKRDKQTAAVAANAAAIFGNAADYIAGDPKGDVTVVEFFDYRCGYCKKARPDVLKLLAADKRIRLIVKEFPILGQESEFASRAAIAAKKQGKYWEFHLALMEEPSIDEATVLDLARRNGLDVSRLKADMEKPDVTAVIDANHALAQKLGIDSTPTFIFGQQVVAGAIDFSRMQDMVAAERKAR